jgi:LacI family transcriptional regulator
MAGVSQTTVSRVLQEHPNVSAATRERVLQVLAQSNYRPNAMARAMKTNRTGTIGVIVARITNPVYPELLEILGRKLALTGHRTVVWDAETGGEDAAIDAIVEGLVDGVVFTTVTKNSPALRRAIECAAPVVLVNRIVEEVPCDQVTSDNLGGAAQIASYFIANQRQRIGLISGPQHASTIRDRERSFRETLHTGGQQIAPELYHRVDNISYKSGNAAMLRLLELAAPPDAVFCANDVLALGALDAARTLGVRVPEDLWIAGYDDIEMASWDAFSLTTVRQPLMQMAHLAIDLLLARVERTTAEHKTYCLSSDFVIRGSTARTPVKRPGPII